MTYTIKLETGEVIRESDSKVVAPAQSVDDPDYQEYVKWINAGNQPTIISQKNIYIPDSISAKQAKMVLLYNNLYDKVQNIINSFEDETTKQAMQIDWEYSTEFYRNSPFIKMVADKLNLSDEDVDNLFIQALNY